MGSIRIIGLMLAGLLVGMAASASASAVESIRFSSTGTFEGKAIGVTKLEVSNGKIVECATTTVKGKVENEVLALALVLFEKCKSKTSFGEATCTSAGSPSGEIHIPHLLVLLGADSGTEEVPAVLLQASNPSTGEPAPVSFKCSLLLEVEVTVKGSVICLAKNQTGVKNSILISCEKGTKAGEQKDKKFWDASQIDVEDFFKTTATGAETFSELESTLQAELLLKGISKEIEIEATLVEAVGEKRSVSSKKQATYARSPQRTSPDSNLNGLPTNSLVTKGRRGTGLGKKNVKQNQIN